MARALKAVVSESVTDDPAPAAVSEPKAAPTSKKIMLVCRNVFLPIDRMDPSWATTSNTEKVQGKDEDGRHVRLEVSAGLADFLVDRRQAELLD